MKSDDKQNSIRFLYISLQLYFLLQELEQEERIVKNIDDIELLYKKEVNFKKSNDIIKQKTKESIQYLKKYV